MNSEELIQKVISEGYSDISVVNFEPNKETGIHTHDTQTIHIMLSGELTLTEGEKVDTLNAGDEFIIPAGTTHNAKAGENGSSFIVGFKK